MEIDGAFLEARRNEAGFIEIQKKNSNVPRRDVVPRIIRIQNVKVLQCKINVVPFTHGNNEEPRLCHCIRELAKYRTVLFACLFHGNSWKLKIRIEINLRR